MLLLSGDVMLHLFEIRLAHGEIRVTALPIEVRVFATTFLQRDVRDAFQFLHPFGLRDGASESREQMNVVFHAANENGRAIELFGDAAEIRMERVARGFVTQERATVFGGEDQMSVNGGKRLWHGVRLNYRGAVRQRERDSMASRYRVESARQRSQRRRADVNHRSIPKGLWPSVRARAGTDWPQSRWITKSNGGTTIRLRIRVNAELWFGHLEHRTSLQTQPRWDCCFPTFFPKVARASQPWADGQNPVRIHGGTTLIRTAAAMG